MKEFYAGSGINSPITETREGRSIVFILEALNRLFDTHFDKGWLLNILDKMSFSSSVLREIRMMVQLTSIHDGDLSKLEAGVESLEEFISFIHRCVQPVLRDELGVSGFTRCAADTDNTTNAVLKEFFIYTFPHNLERLVDLHSQLVPLVKNLRESPVPGTGPMYMPARAVQ